MPDPADQLTQDLDCNRQSQKLRHCINVVTDLIKDCKNCFESLHLLLIIDSYTTILIGINDICIS